MKKLLEDIKKLRKSKLSKTVNTRLKEFKSLGKKGNKEWFSELCFCILTANSKAKTAINIQKELSSNGFICKPKEYISRCIRRNKHRFHNNKANYIVKARKYKNIKDIIKKQEKPRDWLVKNILGLGFKESSHFLRNVGYEDYAIVDRHILNVLKENKILKQKPKTITKKEYLRIENTLYKITKKLNMNQAELDLYLWYMKTNQILK